MSDACPTCNRPWPAPERAAALAAQGLSTAEIAAQMGKSERTVQGYLAAAGAARPRGQGHRRQARCGACTRSFDGERFRWICCQCGRINPESRAACFACQHVHRKPAP